MKQSKADTYVFRKMVDGEVTLFVFVHIDDLAVTAKAKEAVDAFYAQLKKEFSANNMCDLYWFPACAFEREKMEGVIKMTQTALVDLLVGHFDIRYKTPTTVSVEFHLEPKRIYEKEGN